MYKELKKLPDDWLVKDDPELPRYMFIHLKELINKKRTRLKLLLIANLSTSSFYYD